MNKYIKSPINYIGNKYKLLDQIVPLFPDNIDTFVDIFGGSGTVLINVNAKKYIYNDINSYVTEILRGMHTTTVDRILAEIDYIIKVYELSKTNREGFERLRSNYNNGMNDWITLYTLMCYSFNYQFRFNNNHEYNSSFGKDRSQFSDNQRKNLIELSKILQKRDIQFLSKSFTELDLDSLSPGDFVYLDPPYYNSVGNYNDGKRGFEGWTIEHEVRMKDMLVSFNDRGIQWALSNNIGVNVDLENWALEHGFQINYIRNNYDNCSYQKKEKGKNTDVEVLINNFKK